MNFLNRHPNGFLLSIIERIIKLLHLLSPVELIKRIFNRNYEKDNLIDEDKATSSQLNNNLVDLFIIGKWLYIIILVIFNFSGTTNLIFVSVLIFYNLFTYFYYHLWKKDALVGTGFTVNRVRKRFINVLLAIAFSHFGFAYLYCIQFPYDFTNNATNSFIHWFWFSASNAVAANYDAIKPYSCFGYHITMIQLLISFVFITLILSKSLPDAEEN